MTKVQSIALYVILGVLIFLGKPWLQQTFINQGFSWVLSYLFPWVLVLLFSFLIAKNVFGLFKSNVRFWLPPLVFLILPALFFSMFPIYEGDFNQSGKPKDLSENQILSDVLSVKPDFEGLVCVASPNCPFCIEAVQTKIYHVFQRAKIDALVYLGFGDEDTVNKFRLNADAPEMPIVLNSNPEGGLDIDEDVIPVFIFIRDAKIVHLWRNEQLGFPALDWIESGLK